MNPASTNVREPRRDRKVRRALRVIAEEPEMYGLCGECEEPIGKRLKVQPHADLCVECQAERDKPRGTGRKHLTDFR